MTLLTISLLLLYIIILIYSTQSVGAMIWSMAQLRRGQLMMVVGVELSVLARHTHMLHCPPGPTSSWMLWTDRPQFAVCLNSSSVLGSVLLPWRLLLVAIHASFDRSSEMSLLFVWFTGLGSAWRHFIRCRVVQDVSVVFTAFRAKARVAAFRLSRLETTMWRQPSSCGLLLQTVIQLRGISGLAWKSVVFWQRLPRLYQQDDGWVRL